MASSVAPTASLDADVALAAAMIFAGGECPDHQTPWVLKPAGISKAGKPYEAFYTCSGKTDGQYCRRKPSAQWLSAQAPAPAAAPSLEETLDELPF